MTDNKEIISQIRSSLTGQREKDFPYLLKCAEENRNNHEILVELTKIMFSYLQKQMREEDIDLIRKELDVDETYSTVNQLISSRKYEQAEVELEKLIVKIETVNWFTEDEKNTYKNFLTPFEEDLYRYLYQEERTIRTPVINMFNLYLTCGSLLVELKKYEKAKSYIEKALKYNPVNTGALFEYLETLKCLEEDEEYYEKCMETVRYCSSRDDVSRYLRYTGFYFTKMQEYEVAYSCYMVSMAVNNQRNELAMRELDYIRRMSMEEMPDMDKSYEILEELGIPTVPDETVVSLAYEGYIHFLESENRDAAKYYLTIACELSEDEQLAEKLEEME